MNTMKQKVFRIQEDILLEALAPIQTNPRSLAAKVIVPFFAILSLLLLSLSPCNGQNSQALIEAAQNGRLAEVKTLLEGGVDVNAALNDGRTALMAASYFGYTTIVDALLKKQADVNKSTRNGTTALMYACDQGQKDIVDVLLAKGANIDATNNKGETALMEASNGGHSAIVIALINRRADVNKVANNGATALEVARLKGNQEIVEILLKAGAKQTDLVEGLLQNLQSKDKSTRLNAIEELAFKKDARAVKPLLDVLRSGTDQEVSERATFALGNIAGTAGREAVKPLLAALDVNDATVKERAAWALSFARVKDQSWQDAVIQAIRKEDMPVIVGAYWYLIRLGKVDTEEILIKALDRYGSRMMASDFADCGNQKLATAGKEWLNKRGMAISRAVGGISMGPRWGEASDPNKK
jgi:ankyrin repeat protein